MHTSSLVYQATKSTLCLGLGLGVSALDRIFPKDRILNRIKDRIELNTTNAIRRRGTFALDRKIRSNRMSKRPNFKYQVKDLEIRSKGLF